MDPRIMLVASFLMILAGIALSGYVLGKNKFKR